MLHIKQSCVRWCQKAATVLRHKYKHLLGQRQSTTEKAHKTGIHRLMLMWHTRQQPEDLYLEVPHLEI